MIHLLRRIAIATSRTHEETRSLEDPDLARRKVRLASLLFFGVLCPLSILHVIAALSGLGSSSVIVPEVPVSRQLEHVLFHASPTRCLPDARQGDPACFARPANRTIYEARETRADPEHDARRQQHLGEEFWIGIEVPVALLRQAARQKANRFVLGYFEATYRVWVDGMLFVGTRGWYESELVSFLLSEARLKENRPLLLAIEVQHDARSSFPDQLNSFAGAEGFYSEDRFQTYYGHMVIAFKTRPFSLFLAYLALSLAFITFWAPVRIKQEYFFMALHALACGLSQARMMDLFFSGVAPSLGSGMRVLLDGYQAATGLLLALSFARVRSTVLRATGVLVLGGPTLLLFLVTDTHARIQLAGSIRTIAAPSFYVLGALVCLVQATLLQLDRGAQPAKATARSRQLLLALFALGLFALAGSYHWLLPVIWHGAGRAWYGVETFLLVTFLGTIALREYRAQVQAVVRSPVSEYHRRELLPDRINGALIIADLTSAHGAGSAKLSGAWRSHFSAAVLKGGGVVVHHKGHEVIAFFDQDRCASPLFAALTALRESGETIGGLSIEFRTDGAGHRFKAALVRGAIRPVWEEVAGERQAYWEEAGDTTPFVEAARLLEMDPAANSPNHVVMTEETACELAAISGLAQAGTFATRAAQTRDKHGSPFRLAVFDPACSAGHSTPKAA